MNETNEHQQAEETIFDKIEKLHQEAIQMSGKTQAESETKKEEGWN